MEIHITIFKDKQKITKWYLCGAVSVVWNISLLLYIGVGAGGVKRIDTFQWSATLGIIT